MWYLSAWRDRLGFPLRKITFALLLKYLKNFPQNQPVPCCCPGDEVSSVDTNAVVGFFFTCISRAIASNIRLVSRADNCKLYVTHVLLSPLFLYFSILAFRNLLLSIPSVLWCVCAPNFMSQSMNKEGKNLVLENIFAHRDNQEICEQKGSLAR